MEPRLLQRDRDGSTRSIPIDSMQTQPGNGWLWLDIDTDETDADTLMEITAPLHLDRLALRDSVEDEDVPKFEDFGDHCLLVLHGLRDDIIDTYELDCFLAPGILVTVHHGRSAGLEALWSRCQTSVDVGSGGPDELLARLADVLTRRLMGVVEAFDERIDGLVDAALSANPTLLEQLTAVRQDVASVRRVVQPQREALDAARRAETAVFTDAGRRRCSDAFDVATRVGHGLEAARSALTDTLDAYRGAEARQATDVTRVLTVYAAIMLPLSLIAGFFGMNFTNLPLVERSNGWIITTAIMGGVAVFSLGMFIAAGWIRRASGRQARKALGKGLLEAARAPVELVGSLLEVPVGPLTSRVSRHHRQAPSDTRPEHQ